MRLLTLKRAPVTTWGLSAVGCLSGGRQLPAKPSSGASVVGGTGASASPGPLTPGPWVLPLGPSLSLGTGGNGKQNTLWRLVGIHFFFALGRWLETVTCAKLVFPDWHQMVWTHGVASAVWSVHVCVLLSGRVGGWVLCVMDMLLKSCNMGNSSVCYYG